MIEHVGYTKPVNTAARAAAVKRAGSADAAAFAEALARAEGSFGVDAAEAPVAAAPLTGINLLSLQEISDDDIRRQKSLKHGRLTLDALGQLRDALLIGVLPRSILHNLEAIVAAERAASPDPRLDAILSEIETRAAVELAKLEMGGF